MMKRDQQIRVGHEKHTVQDTGIGIKKEHFRRLFKEFEQLQSGAHPHEGTGLGLALTQQKSWN